MRFTIRKYRSSDFPTLLAIDQFCFEPGIAYTAYELKTYILRRAAFTFVAESDNGSNAGATTKVGSVPDSSIIGFIVGERIRGAGHIITIDVRGRSPPPSRGICASGIRRSRTALLEVRHCKAGDRSR